MRPSLLEPSRAGRDAGSCFRRGVRDGQWRDELLVGFVPSAVLRLTDAPKDEVRDRTIQDTEQIHLIHTVRWQDAIDPHIVKVLGPIEVSTNSHLRNGLGHDQFRDILLAPLENIHFVRGDTKSRRQTHWILACEGPAPIGASASRLLESAVPYHRRGSGIWRRARRVRRGTGDTYPSPALRSASPPSRRPALMIASSISPPRRARQLCPSACICSDPFRDAGGDRCGRRWFESQQ